MKKNNRLKILLGFLGAILAVYFSAFSHDCLAIDEETFDKPLRPSVCFIHDDHNDTAGIDDCTVCHHVYEDGKLLEDESSEDSSCSECHYDNNDAKQLGLVVKFHKRCRGCHLDQKTGPITCGGCHTKTN